MPIFCRIVRGGPFRWYPKKASLCVNFLRGFAIFASALSSCEFFQRWEEASMLSKDVPAGMQTKILKKISANNGGVMANVGSFGWETG